MTVPGSEQQAPEASQPWVTLGEEENLDSTPTPHPPVASSSDFSSDNEGSDRAGSERDSDDPKGKRSVRRVQSALRPSKDDSTSLPSPDSQLFFNMDPFAYDPPIQPATSDRSKQGEKWSTMLSPCPAMAAHFREEPSDLIRGTGKGSLAQSSLAQCFQAQGSQAQGSQAQGSQAQGSQAQGSQAQGSQAEGSQAEGSQDPKQRHPKQTVPRKGILKLRDPKERDQKQGSLKRRVLKHNILKQIPQADLE